MSVALAEGDQRILDMLLAHARVGLVVCSADLTILAISEVASRQLGLPRTALVGQNVHSLRQAYPAFHPDGTPADGSELPLSRATRNGAVIRDEHWIYEDVDGRRRNVLVNAEPLKDNDGKIVGGIASWTDISAVKSIEEGLRSALAVEGTLLREANFRIRNHLQMVVSLVQMESLKLGPEGSRLAKAIEDRLAALAAAYEDLYSCGHKTGVPAGDMLRGVARIFDGSRHAIRVDADADIVVATAQVTPVALAVNEAVSNALEHAFDKTGGGTVEVALRAQAQGRLALTITDDGRGIAGGADGLGLKILAALANQLGGSLSVGSRDGGGTLVRLVFPHGDEETS